jgi:hypothetical protein
VVAGTATTAGIGLLAPETLPAWGETLWAGGASAAGSYVGNGVGNELNGQPFNQNAGTAATIGGALGVAGSAIAKAANAATTIKICPVKSLNSVAKNASDSVTPAVRNAIYNGGIENVPQAERVAAAKFYDQIAQNAQNPVVKAYNQARANYAKNGGTPPGGIGNFK